MENEVFRMLLKSSKKYIPVEPYTYLQIIPDEDVIITKENNFFGSCIFDYCIVNNKKLTNNIKLKQNKIYNIYVDLYLNNTSTVVIPNYTTIYDETKQDLYTKTNTFISCSSNKIDTIFIRRNLNINAFIDKTTLKSVTIYNSCVNIRDFAFINCNNIEYFNYVGTPQEWAYIQAYTNISKGSSYLPSVYTKIKFNNQSLIPNITFDTPKTTRSVSLFNNIDLNIFDSGLLTFIDNYMLSRSNINKCILRDTITNLYSYSIQSYITNFEFHINHTINVYDNAINTSQQIITNLNIISEHNDLGCLAYLFNNQHGNPIQRAVINPILVNGIVHKKAITPNDVTIIGLHTFYGLSQLEEVIISDSVITVMSEMCYDSNVKYIKYGNSVKTIGNYCSSQVTQVVDFGESIESIGEGSISNRRVQDPLKAIVIRNPAPPSISYNTIRYIDKDVPFYVPDEAVDTYKTTDMWAEFTNILPLSEYDYNNYK